MKATEQYFYAVQRGSNFSESVDEILVNSMQPFKYKQLSCGTVLIMLYNVASILK